MSEQNDWQSRPVDPVTGALVMEPGAGPETLAMTDPPGLLRPGLAGAGAAVAGALAWAAVTFVTKMQIGFMAVGIGVLVALVVRKYGARTQTHAILSGALSLGGCVLGNLLSSCAFYSDAKSVPLQQVVFTVLGNPSVAVSFIQQTFQPMDGIFYAIATYEGFKLVLRKR